MKMVCYLSTLPSLVQLCSLKKFKRSLEILHTSLKDAEKRLEGYDKIQFLKFVRRMLKWKPEERSSTRELMKKPWLSASH
jgi:hypothetical protein